jgi:hypothetical protein
MRRECGLAERAEYFYTPMPGTARGNFNTRYVRLAFKHARPGERAQQYWLYWDAALTGGGALNASVRSCTDGDSC